MNSYFTMLPNNLFYTKNDDDKSLLKLTCNHKVLLVLDYLHINTNRMGITKFTVEDIITSYGFKPRTGKDRINNQIKHILVLLQRYNIIKTNSDIGTIKINDMVSCQYDGIEDNKNFTKVDYNVFTNILNYEDKHIDNVKLLYYYCYLCCRMFTRKNNSNITVYGGNAEICFPGYETITSDTNITSDAIKEYNDILVENNVLRIGNLGLFYYKDDKNKIPRESPNFYTFVSDEDLKIQNDKDTVWYNNLKEGMKYFKKKHDDRVFLGTREYKTNKSIKNFIGRIEQLEKDLKATKEQIQKKNELKKSLSLNNLNATELKDKIENRYKNILEIDDAYNLDLDIFEDWKEYLPNLDNEHNVHTVEDYKKVLEEIEDIEKEMNKKLEID